MTAVPAARAESVATDSLVQKYMRSSLYTLILNSDTQNKYYEEETAKGENADALMSIAKSIAKTDDKKAANDSVAEESIFALPAKIFPTIEIPNQFNDHNLATRVLDFDAIKGQPTGVCLAKYVLIISVLDGVVVGFGVLFWCFFGGKCFVGAL